MRIVSIAPHVKTQDESRELAEKSRCSSPDTNLEFSYLATGPKLVENEIHAAQAMWPLVNEVIAAERGGADAVIIDCFLDPGLYACRESVSIPVIGPGLASIGVALMHGHRIGILNPNELGREFMLGNLRRYGVENHIKFVDGLLPKSERIQECFEAASAQLRTRYADIQRMNTCDVLILGCTAFEALREVLPPQPQGKRIPILLPYQCAVWAAEMAVRNRL